MHSQLSVAIFIASRNRLGAQKSLITLKKSIKLVNPWPPVRLLTFCRDIYGHFTSFALWPTLLQRFLKLHHQHEIPHKNDNNEIVARNKAFITRDSLSVGNMFENEDVNL